jgi:hypothetical protein
VENLMEGLEKATKELLKVKFPQWTKDSDSFMKAVDINVVAPQVNLTKKALQIFSTIQGIVGFKMTSEDRNLLKIYTELRTTSSIFLSAYTVTLLVRSKGWDRITPDIVTKGGAPAELHKALEDAVNIVTSSESIKIDSELLAMAMEKLGLGKTFLD